MLSDDSSVSNVANAQAACPALTTDNLGLPGSWRFVSVPPRYKLILRFSKPLRLHTWAQEGQKRRRCSQIQIRGRISPLALEGTRELSSLSAACLRAALSAPTESTIN